MNLQEGALELGVSLDAGQLARFDTYLALLQDWNQRMSLTTITDSDEVVTKHFLDSLSCLLALPAIDRQPVQQWLQRPLRAVDVGAGAGFPGLPLKIAWPALRLTLVETTGKKCLFLEQVVADLGLQHVTVVNERAEDFGQGSQRASFDLAVARALSRLPTLLEYCLPLLKTGGWLIAQKGKEPQEEVASARVALNTLGGSLHDILPVAVPGLDAQRALVIVAKAARTPAGYPRKAGTPQRQPLL
ncbi:MAG: 16S rRNA (guanine(527)-N(7))-methyltransferase RsmG [Caldilineales bacterium]